MPTVNHLTLGLACTPHSPQPPSLAHRPGSAPERCHERPWRFTHMHLCRTSLGIARQLLLVLLRSLSSLPVPPTQIISALVTGGLKTNRETLNVSSPHPPASHHTLQPNGEQIFLLHLPQASQPFFQYIL